VLRELAGVSRLTDLIHIRIGLTEKGFATEVTATGPIALCGEVLPAETEALFDQLTALFSCEAHLAVIESIERLLSSTEKKIGGAKNGG